MEFQMTKKEALRVLEVLGSKSVADKELARIFTRLWFQVYVKPATVRLDKKTKSK